MHKVEPIFLIFPLILFVLAFIKRKNARSFAYFLCGLAYFFIFICSKNGADYTGYLSIFNSIENGVVFEEIHGEKLFLLFMKIFIDLGLGYDIFRIVFLSFFTLLFLYSAYKLSPSPILTFLLMFLSYIIYLISAYRQFAVMAITVYCFYIYLVKNKKIFPILLLIVGLFIHVSSIMPLVYFVCLNIFDRSKFVKINEKTNSISLFAKRITKNFIVIMVICLLFRIILYYLLKIDSVGKFADKLVGSYPEKTLFSVGLLSRTVTVFIISMCMKEFVNSKAVVTIYVYYFMCMMCYIVFPYENLMGRLMNAGRVMDVILIPIIALEKYNSFKKYNRQTICYQNLRDVSFVGQNVSKKIILVFFLVITTVMYVYQLLTQGGYYPYVSMFFGK